LRCLLYPRKRTSVQRSAMALCQKQTKCVAAKIEIVDHLVSGGDQHREMAKLNALTMLRLIGTHIFKKKRRLAKQTVASLSTSKL
jgi:hypothetical protein